MADFSEDFGFKYPVGAVLMMRDPHPDPASEAWPPRLIVLDRVLAQCYGGVQRFYECRFITECGNFGTAAIRLVETELVPWEAPPPREDHSYRNSYRNYLREQARQAMPTKDDAASQEGA